MADAQNVQTTTELPPAGHARDEELRKRTDNLDEAGENLAAESGTERINPKAFEPIREIQYHLDELAVSNQDPAYDYCWVGTYRAMYFIKTKQVRGWEVVQGNLLEAIELKGIGADTTRRLGDAILMRVKKDIHFRLLAEEKAKRLAREGAAVGELQELADKHARHGIKLHVGAADPRMLKRMAAQGVAEDQFDTMLRKGEVPGMPVSGPR